MSDITTKIREAVMAASRGDREEVRALLGEVTTEKAKNKVHEMFEGETRDVVDWSDVKKAAMKTAKKVHGSDVDMKKVNGIINNAKKHKPDSTQAAVELVQDMLRKKDEGAYMASGKKHMRAAHRHMNAGKKDMKKKRDMHRDGDNHVKEENDTGSDSSVMGGKYDYDIHDPTKRKGSVKKTGKIDHKDYDGDEPNAYTKKDAVSGKPVNEMSEDEIKSKIDALQKDKVNTNGHQRRARIQSQIDDLKAKLEG